MYINGERLRYFKLKQISCTKKLLISLFINNLVNI